MGGMPTAAAAFPSVYQLRVVLDGVSPLIWRRLLVAGDTTIAGLHAVLQAGFGWDGTHLHRFTIHGAEYGLSYPGGLGFRDDARRVCLTELGLRTGERVVYDYNFTDGWRLDLRVEQIVDTEPGSVYPRCTGGRRAGPPQDCGGPWAFTEATQPHLVFAAVRRAGQIIGQLLGAQPDDELATLGVDRNELAALMPLLGLERFDRRGLNRALAGLTTAPKGSI